VEHMKSLTTMNDNKSIAMKEDTTVTFIRFKVILTSFDHHNFKNIFIQTII